jgi:sec-independent protein translocase protein TatA
MQLGWPEIILIMIVLILLFGSGKLAEAGRELGKGLGSLNKEREN